MCLFRVFHKSDAAFGRLQLSESTDFGVYATNRVEKPVNTETKNGSPSTSIPQSYPPLPDKTRGRYLVCAIVTTGQADTEMRIQYKQWGYRLMKTEPLFVHRLTRIPKKNSAVKIRLLRTNAHPEAFAKSTRSRSLTQEEISSLAYRQYPALDGETLVGYESSIPTLVGNKCSHMFDCPSH